MAFNGFWLKVSHFSVSLSPIDRLAFKLQVELTQQQTQQPSPTSRGTNQPPAELSEQPNVDLSLQQGVSEGVKHRRNEVASDPAELGRAIVRGASSSDKYIEINMGSAIDLISRGMTS